MKFPLYYRTNTSYIKVEAPNQRTIVSIENGDARIVYDAYHSERNINRCVDEWDEARNGDNATPTNEADFLLTLRRAQMMRGNARPADHIIAKA